MKQIQLLIIFLLSGFAASAFGDASEPVSAPAISAEELHSEWWPPFVRLAKPLELTDRDKVLNPGRRGVMVRVEGDEVLVDFGQYGIHSLPFADTDFEQQYQENSETRKWSHHGLFTKTYGTRFYHPEGWDQLHQSDILDRDFFVIAYADLQNDGDRELIQEFDQEIYANWQPENVQVYLIPLNVPEQIKLTETLTELEISTPTMPSFLAPGHVTALHHHPENFTVVLIDKNGRLLARFATDDASDMESLKAELSRRIASARKSISQGQANI